MLNLLLAIIVSASIDSTTLFIGDQTQLRLQAVSERNEHVQMPVYGEYLIPGIEIVRRTGVDSTLLKDGRYHQCEFLKLCHIVKTHSLHYY